MISCIYKLFDTIKSIGQKIDDDKSYKNNAILAPWPQATLWLLRHHSKNKPKLHHFVILSIIFDATNYYTTHFCRYFYPRKVSIKRHLKSRNSAKTINFRTATNYMKITTICHNPDTIITTLTQRVTFSLFLACKLHYAKKQHCHYDTMYHMNDNSSICEKIA